MPRTNRSLLHAAAVAVLIAPAAAGGQLLDVAPSARIRVDVLSTDSLRVARFGRPRAQPVIGTVRALPADTLLLSVTPGAEPLRVPRSAIHAVYASRGRPPRWESALRSAVVPALAGAAFRGVAASVRRRDGDPTPARAALTGAAAGAAFAAVRGALFPKERWERLPLAAPASDSLALGRRGGAASPGAPPR